MSDNHLSFMLIVISWLPFIIVHAEKFARLLSVIIPIVKVILIKVELCSDGGFMFQSPSEHQLGPDIYSDVACHYHLANITTRAPHWL